MDLKEALAGYAGWLGHGHGERAAAWLQRLELNRPELEAFRSAPAPSAPAYVARRFGAEPARGVDALAAHLPADAPKALERARSRSDLHAFTFLPGSLPPAGHGLLAGVPVAVKDLMGVAGMALTCGSRAFDAAPAAMEAEVVTRLKRAGAVVIGLANLHEFAYGITSDNPRFGRVVNPAAPGRIPGGSSGGSAAAVAAGVVRLAIGTDTAGSIRVPAACCGIIGFKPGYDALPRNGVFDLGPTLDHVGPMTLTVEDAASMFAAMLGMDALPRWADADSRGRTIARLGGYFEDPLDAEVAAALDGAEGALREDGAQIVHARIEGMELAPAVMLNTLAHEAGAVHAQRVNDRGHEYGEDVRVRVEMADFLPGHWYVKAQRMRTELVAAIDAGFGAADLFLCATLRTPAPAVGAARVDIGGRSFALHTAVTQLTMPFNLAGLPAISLPWTRTREGVPICVQLAGRRGSDWQVLSAAQRLQQASPWAGGHA
ncbi:MAG TPA: amidase [Usitatibacter sp.]|nr:amidase [Usitatibacter sp.]